MPENILTKSEFVIIVQSVLALFYMVLTSNVLFFYVMLVSCLTIFKQMLHNTMFAVFFLYDFVLFVVRLTVLIS